MGGGASSAAAAAGNYGPHAETGAAVIKAAMSVEGGVAWLLAAIETEKTEKAWLAERYEWLLSRYEDKCAEASQLRKELDAARCDLQLAHSLVTPMRPGCDRMKMNKAQMLLARSSMPSHHLAQSSSSHPGHQEAASSSTISRSVSAAASGGGHHAAKALRGVGVETSPPPRSEVQEEKKATFSEDVRESRSKVKEGSGAGPAPTAERERSPPSQRMQDPKSPTTLKERRAMMNLGNLQIQDSHIPGPQTSRAPLAKVQFQAELSAIASNGSNYEDDKSKPPPNPNGGDAGAGRSATSSPVNAAAAPAAKPQPQSPPVQQQPAPAALTSYEKEAQLAAAKAANASNAATAMLDSAEPQSALLRRRKEEWTIAENAACKKPPVEAASVATAEADDKMAATLSVRAFKVFSMVDDDDVPSSPKRPPKRGKKFDT
eukprot:TRINITY_DN76303_c0_g1_i1.p1 TRINITY_DN76303_c0_g1~~TRINITY_DN76303_c0_g1_i1.p1  ORF type:complete len:432 (-),score=141.29 TRINITY_DN76303_c0_g1_i1:150-1445(-)